MQLSFLKLFHIQNLNRKMNELCCFNSAMPNKIIVQWHFITDFRYWETYIHGIKGQDVRVHTMMQLICIGLFHSRSLILNGRCQLKSLMEFLNLDAFI